MTHKILMFHGKEGSPHGRKSTYLRNNPSYTAHIPSYPSNEGPVEDVFDTCYEIAKKELAEMNPDLVVGSSFGGGILLRLVTEGLWTGPSLFLAQAGVHYNISETLPQNVPCLCIHGAKDTIIDVRDSEKLARSSDAAKMVVLPNDGHRLESLLGGLFDLSIEYLLTKV